MLVEDFKLLKNREIHFFKIGQPLAEVGQTDLAFARKLCGGERGVDVETNCERKTGFQARRDVACLLLESLLARTAIASRSV
jgi:hypothetical protein